MPKYDFHKLKAKENKDPLPEDINEQIEKLADKIGDTEGRQELINYRVKKFFDTVTLFDKTGRLVAEASFDHGICFMYRLYKYRTNGMLLSRCSIKNEKLESEKRK